MRHPDVRWQQPALRPGRTRMRGRQPGLLPMLTRNHRQTLLPQPQLLPVRWQRPQKRPQRQPQKLLPLRVP